MADSAKPNRFRIVLSFPGEHRSRVEKIAHLSRLYRDQSELIAVFLCKEYQAKKWCGLEWRACRELLMNAE